MSTLFQSFNRSPLGAFIRSPLGARGLDNNDEPPAAPGKLFVCGDFSGNVAMYDNNSQLWISIGGPTDPEYLFIHDGKLHAGGRISSNIWVMNAINDWSSLGAPYGGTTIDAISYGGYITAVSDLDGTVWQRISGSWVQLGGAISGSGYLHVNEGSLWAGRSRLEGSTWVEYDTWAYESFAGFPNIVDYRSLELKPCLKAGGSSYGNGFYSFGTSMWEFEEVLPIKHNEGSESVNNGYVYTGGGSDGWEFISGDSIGTEITIATIDFSFLLFDHGGTRYLFNSNVLYSGAPPLRVTNYIIPLVRAHYAISYNGNIIFVGEADSDGAIQQYDGANYEFMGVDNSYPNGPIYHIIAADITLGILINDVSPNTASIRGGDTITVSGNNFTSTTVILVDGQPVSTTYVNPQEVTFLTEAHIAGTIDIAASDDDGENLYTLNNGLTFEEIQISSVSPTTGSVAGGEPVDVIGKYFATGTEVRIGANLATDIVVNDPTSISCTTPAGTAGLTDVSVQYASESDTLTDGFEYIAAPAEIIVTSISPDTGSVDGGLSVTITGTGFTSDCIVIFSLRGEGSETAENIIIVSDSEITCDTPEWGFSIGAVNVVVSDTVTLDQGSLDGGFTYT